MEALRALSNPKTALVKKRQLMRVHCGDYRKKMAQEEKQYYSSQFKQLQNLAFIIMLIISNHLGVAVR